MKLLKKKKDTLLINDRDKQPREAVVPHPWRLSRPGWMGPWAA